MHSSYSPPFKLSEKICLTYRIKISLQAGAGSKLAQQSWVKGGGGDAKNRVSTAGGEDYHMA